MLKHYEIAHSPGDLGDVPICGKYCDDWFEACKDDKTCTRDWLEGKLTQITRKSSCVNARGIWTAAYQVVHLLPEVGYPLGQV